MIRTPLLIEAMPELALELRLLLTNFGRPELAAQTPGLRIVDRCRCGCNDCATFYSEALPNGPWANLGRHECLNLNVKTGIIILDLVEGRIMHVEILDRPELRKKLHDAVP